MITREEALESTIRSARKYIESLEARIAELEASNSCDGCKYEKCELDTKLHDLYCANCSRIYVDYYEPKGENNG